MFSIRMLLDKGQSKKLYLFVYLIFVEHLQDAQNFHSNERMKMQTEKTVSE